MLVAGIVKFDIGSAASCDFTDEYVAFCERSLKSIVGSDITITNAAGRDSIPFSIEQITDDGQIVYTKTIEHIREWIESVDIILIDINDPRDLFVPGRADLHMTAALNSLQKEYDESYEKLLVILRKRIPHKNDLSLSALHDIEAAGKLIIVGDDGNMSGAYPVTQTTKEEYRLDRLAVKGSSKELLSARMIRRRGHFHDNHGRLQTFFFDGHRCQPQLRELISEFIDDQCDNAQPTLVYHCTISKWLTEPVLTAAHSNKLDLHVLEAGQKLLIEKPDIDEDILDRVILIVPRVESGTTLENLISSIKKINGNSQISVLAIISTQSPGEMKREIFVDGELYPITFFLRDIKDKLYSYDDGDCQLCKVSPALKPEYEKEEYANLTSFEFHTMAAETGWIDEGDVPIGRQPVGLVPDFVSMLDANGSYLAHKMLQLLRYHVGEDFPAKAFLIAYPEQDGASSVARYLRLLHSSVTLIKIPNDELDNQRMKPGSQLLNEKAHWCRQVQSAGPTQAIVLMEEFVRDGGTKSAMIDLAKTLRKNISCHVALATFSDKPSLSHSVPTYSLYHLPLQ